MNILVFSWRDPKHPLAGGAEQVMHEHMKGWIAAGHSVTLFSSYFKNAKREEKLDEVKVIRRGIQYWGVQILGALYYLFGNTKYDLVVDQFHGIPFFTPLYVRVPKLAVLQEVARDVWLTNDLPFPFDKIIGIIGYVGEPLLYLPYKKVNFMVGSESAKEDVVKIGINKNLVTVVPHGVLLDDKPRVLPKKEKIITIVHLGALAKDKGIEDTIETFGLLNKVGKYQFWIIGRGGGAYLDYLKKKVRDLGIKENTTFWGFVTDSEKFDLLARAHVMINPSLLEGFGLVNIEANTVGTPVVGYTSRGLVDSIRDGDSGALVSPNTPQALATSVDGIIRDGKTLRRLQKSSVKWSKNFTWEKSKKKSLQLIDVLIDKAH